jgi:hypothetical protein
MPVGEIVGMDAGGIVAEGVRLYFGAEPSGEQPNRNPIRKIAIKIIGRLFIKSDLHQFQGNFQYFGIYCTFFIVPVKHPAIQKAENGCL